MLYTVCKQRQASVKSKTYIEGVNSLTIFKVEGDDDDSSINILES